MTDYPCSKLLKILFDRNPSIDVEAAGSEHPAKYGLSTTVVDKAIQEGLGGILFRSLKKRDETEQLVKGNRVRLEQVYYAGVRKNVRLQQALLEILEQANALDLRVVLLQGISLLEDVYTDIGLRALTDIDLWVLPDDFSRFSEILNSLGYHLRKPYQQVFFKNGVCVDVHTHLLWAERIKSRSKLLPSNQGEIFSRAEKGTVQDAAACRLNPTDQFVYLSLHCLKHYVQRLIWLVDLVCLSENWTVKDWFALQKRASELGQKRTVQYILYLLEDLAAYRPPKAGGLFQEPPLKAWEKAILNIRKENERLPTWAPIALMPNNLNLAQRARFVFEHLFPDPSVLREVFSSKSELKNWQLYGLRVLQLAGLKKPD